MTGLRAFRIPRIPPADCTVRCTGCVLWSTAWVALYQLPREHALPPSRPLLRLRGRAGPLSTALRPLGKTRGAKAPPGTPVATRYGRDFGSRLIPEAARCMTTHRGWPPQHRAGVSLGERAGSVFYVVSILRRLPVVFKPGSPFRGNRNSRQPSKGCALAGGLSHRDAARRCSFHILGMTRIRRVVTYGRPRAEPPGTLAKTVRNP